MFLLLNTACNLSTKYLSVHWYYSRSPFNRVDNVVLIFAWWITCLTNTYKYRRSVEHKLQYSNVMKLNLSKHIILHINLKNTYKRRTFVVVFDARYQNIKISHVLFDCFAPSNAISTNTPNKTFS